MATKKLTQYQVEREVNILPKSLYVDRELLNEKIQASGLKISFLCEKLALSRTAFWKKANGTTPFKVPEVFVLCTLLVISDEDRVKIFYPKEQPKSC